MAESATTASRTTTASVLRVKPVSCVTSTMPAPPTLATRPPSATRASSTDLTRADVRRGFPELTATRTLTSAWKVSPVSKVSK
jgi:hypothetical protein